MSFRNPIVAGNVLVRNAIQSPNYVAGSMGWIIRRDGSAEFSNAIFRGSIDISGSNNLLMYSGTPGPGDLVIALAPNAGSDTYGNGYAQGLTIGQPGGSQVVIGLTGGTPLIYFPTGNAGLTNSTGLQTIVQGTGNAEYDQFQILGAKNTTQADSVLSSWLASSTDGTQQPQIQDYYHDPSGTYHLYRELSYAGNVSIGPVTAVQPGTGISRTTPAVAETWHTASLQTGFTTGGTDQAPRFRLDGLAGGVTRLDGTVYTSAAVVAGALMFNVGAAYAPKTRKRFVQSTNASGNALGAAIVNVATTGAVTIGAAANAANQQIVLDGITWPID